MFARGTRAPGVLGTFLSNTRQFPTWSWEEPAGCKEVVPVDGVSDDLSDGVSGGVSGGISAHLESLSGEWVSTLLARATWGSEL